MADAAPGARAGVEAGRAAGGGDVSSGSDGDSSSRRILLSSGWPVLRLFPYCVFSSRAQGSSGVVATVPLVWRGHTKSTAARSGPGPDLAMWLE